MLKKLVGHDKGVKKTMHEAWRITISGEGIEQIQRYKRKQATPVENK
jgi:hypothetical protein